MTEIPVTASAVAAVRDASRRLVRELGFMNTAIAGTDLPASSVHALIEIEAEALAASDLCTRLRLEKSSVSRMLRKLVAAGLVEERPDSGDGRVKVLALTAAGAACVGRIHDHARGQVAAALGRMPPAARETVQAGLALYAGALQPAVPGRAVPALQEGYRPGLIARITGMHADYYSRMHGFGQVFESRVAAGLAEFCDRLERPCNRIWTVAQGGVIQGSIAIDGEDLGPGPDGGRAHLRWFIVDDSLRGTGAGKALLAAAMGFVDAQGFAETHLDTFAGLDAARRLYEGAGFRLVAEAPGAHWGREVREQRFVRP